MGQSRTAIVFQTVWRTLAVVALCLLAVWSYERRDRGERAGTATDAILDTPPPPMSAPQRWLDGELSRLGGGFAGHVGIAVTSAGDRETTHFNGLERFPQQSVSKLWVALTALDRVDRNELDLDEMVAVRFEDLTVFYQPIRKRVLREGVVSTDYRDLIERALAQSDNTANDLTLRRVGGPEAVQEWLDANDLSAIRFGADERTKQSWIAGLEWRQSFAVGPAFFDARDRVGEAVRRARFEAYLADPVDGAPPAAIATALARLAEGDLLDRDTTRLILDVMASAKSGPQRLKGGVPEGWSIAHKTGTGQFFDGEQSGYNDVGILTAPDGSRYGVAVMIARTRAPTPARFELMQSVTRAVAEYHRRRAAPTSSPRPQTASTGPS